MMPALPYGAPVEDHATHRRAARGKIRRTGDRCIDIGGDERSYFN
jgi:hypothetical protein